MISPSPSRRSEPSPGASRGGVCSMPPCLLALALCYVGAIVGGCASTPREVGSNELLLFVGRDTYVPADSIHLMVTNRTGQLYGYGLCAGNLELQTGNSWVSISPKLYHEPRQTEDICTLEMPMIEPGQTRSHSFRLSQDLQRGIYRWCGDATPIAEGETGTMLPFCSEPFRINP